MDNSCNSNCDQGVISVNGQVVNDIGKIIMKMLGLAEWLGSCAPLQAAQCFVGSNPGCRHGTAHQTTLRGHPTCHNQKDPQQRIYNQVLGGFGEKKGKKKLKVFKKNNENANSRLPSWIGRNIEIGGVKYEMRSFRIDRWPDNIRQQAFRSD